MLNIKFPRALCCKVMIIVSDSCHYGVKLSLFVLFVCFTYYSEMDLFINWYLSVSNIYDCAAYLAVGVL